MRSGLQRQAERTVAMVRIVALVGGQRVRGQLVIVDVVVAARMPDVAGGDDVGIDMIQAMPAGQQGLQQRQHGKHRGCTPDQQRPGLGDHRPER